MSGGPRHALARDGARRPEPGDEERGLGSRPQAPLVPGPEHELGQGRGTPPDVERPDPLGRVELVARYREKVDPEGARVHRQLAQALGGVRVEQDRRFLGHTNRKRPAPLPLPLRRAACPRGLEPSGDLRDGVDGSDLVVGVHDGDEHRPRGHRPGDALGAHPPVGVHPEEGGLEAVLADQVPHHLKYRVVLHRRGDDVVSVACCFGRQGRPAQAVVDGLSTAAHEHHLVRVCVHQRRDAPPGLLVLLLGGLAEGVPA
mmetsp:Transcript_16362/g.37926  ORF Transcript_16362/g.37926 Transcript_16362/m.37926 type:complete len:258 (-) Transcript_16362:190-963(-)